jgi:predicted CoA-substrate-specific enzyme activase
MMNFIGLDAGSVSVKLVMLDKSGNKLYSRYKRHKGLPLSVVLELLKAFKQSKEYKKAHNGESGPSLSVTGSAGRLIASIFNIEPANEIVAQAYATHVLFPHIRTIIEMGGEDSKLILMGENSHSAKDFSMNSVCAAGTGSFLDQQAERLRITIEEFSELALKSKSPPRIAGRCSVFAKSDMIHLQQIATPVEDIVAGLCFAMARNFKGSIARGRHIIKPVSFQGGVAANKGLVRAFREIFGLEELFVPDNYALMGAIGAALKNRDEGVINKFDLSKLDTFLKEYKPTEEGYPALKDKEGMNESRAEDVPLSKIRHALSSGPVSLAKTRAYLGIDVGSISTNLAVTDESGRLLAKRYLMTAGRPIEAVRQGLNEIGNEIGDKVEIMGVGTTGSGRYMIADYVGADIVKNEITAQATAAAFIDKDVDTIFEIGGQDSKYISLQHGIIVDFEMNKACAAGTGSFLEEQAEKLNIAIKGEFQERAFSAKNPCRLGERCTVFMENSLMANLQKGADKDDLLAGLAYSIVQNYINRVVAGKKIGNNIFFQGGVAFNRSVHAAFEKYLGEKITIPPHHDVTGAIGMALISKIHMEALRSHGNGKKKLNTTFKGFELSKRPYEISSFECKACPNVCEINRVKVTGEEGFLFYGGRCEKYDVKRKKKSDIPDLFSLRDELLWKTHENYKAGAERRSASLKTKIGIPYIFYFHDYLPFWTAFLWELGFDVEVSPKTDRQIVGLGLERVLSEACFPVKIAHGHIKYLLDRNVDTLFLPSFINLNAPGDSMDKGLGCPYTQTIPYIARIAFSGIKTITPVINLREGRKFLIRELEKALKPFGIKKAKISGAVDMADKVQNGFSSAVREKGNEILSSLKQNAVVMIGRSYNALDSGVNLELPRKLANLGVLSIPFDFLPIERYSIDTEWPNMYWRSGQRILKTARYVKETTNLYPIYIGNFLCGPDSFILKYFKKEMGEKPFLQLEIDEHSADAGAITRCEAFLDSIQNRVADDELRVTEKRNEQPFYPSASVLLSSSQVSPHSSRTIYIPRMSDHAFAVAAAFEHCGVKAEVLPESDKKTADIGRKHVSGKECYPCTVTTGDMVKKVQEPDFIPGESAFFMPSGTGPCRFGQYNVFHRMVLDSLGYSEIPIFSPNQDTSFYRDLGIVGKDFSLHAWKGVIAFELLKKSLHETRPYERQPGSADRLHKDYHDKIYQSLRNGDTGLEKILMNIKRDFENIPGQSVMKPLIGVIGEIFVRSHRFSNENLVRKVEALGGEVWLAPVEEWIYYVNLVGIRRALLKKEKSAIINFLLKKFFQKRIEYRYGKYFKGFLKTLEEPDTKEILEKASPYLHSSFEGEAILSIGKSIDLLEKGASGIINAMPFGCMPGTIVTALLRGINRDYGIPCISIPYDGTESLTTEIQLEAFMDQAKEYRRQKEG